MRNVFRSGSRFRPAVVALVLASVVPLLMLPAACQQREAPPPPAKPIITVARPIAREVIEWDEYTGRLASVETVELRARVSGFVTEAPFVEGSLVKAGDVLFVIDVRPFQAALDEAQAEVAEADARRQYAESEFKRLEPLRASGTASETEYSQALQSLRQAEAEVAAARARVETARLNVEWCNVTAPIDGRASSKFITPGNLVTGGAGQGSPTVLTTITRTDPIYVYIDADERSVLRYQELSRTQKRISARDSRIPAFLALSNDEGFPHGGVVDFVDNRIDPETGTLRARAVFDNPNGYLLPGFFGRVRIPGSGRYDALLVIDSAIGSDQGQRFVLVLGADGKLESRTVKVGAMFDGLRAVEGIGPDERIVINGLQRARPGAEVDAQEVPMPEPQVAAGPTASGSPATRGLPTTAEVAAAAADAATQPAAGPYREGALSTPPSDGRQVSPSATTRPVNRGGVTQ